MSLPLWREKGCDIELSRVGQRQVGGFLQYLVLTATIAATIVAAHRKFRDVPREQSVFLNPPPRLSDE